MSLDRTRQKETHFSESKPHSSRSAMPLLVELKGHSLACHTVLYMINYQFLFLLPQILATTAKNFLLLDLGLAVAFPTIVIPALMGLNNENNPNETVQLTAVQASWLGSIGYIMEPLGSILSGWISEPLGRKRAMMIVNIPHLFAWLLLYYSTTLWEIFLANILLGLGVGVMEAPIITYVGEIW